LSKYNFNQVENLIELQKKINSRYIHIKLLSSIFFYLTSDVAQYVTWLNSLYDPTKPLAAIKDEAEDYAAKLNDIRTVIKDTMETLFSYNNLYNRINETHIDVKNQCTRIEMLHNKTNQSIAEGKEFINEARGLLIDAENNIQVRVRIISLERIIII